VGSRSLVGDVNLQANWGVSDSGDVQVFLFNKLSYEEGLTHIKICSWQTTKSVEDGHAILASLDQDMLFSYGSSVRAFVLFRGHKTRSVMLVELCSYAEEATHVFCRFGSHDLSNVAPVEELLRELLPEASPGEGELTFRLWSKNPNGYAHSSRKLVVPYWEEVLDNYETSTAEAITRLVDSGPSGRGKLILWHGEPGTGKTYAIRALAKEWEDSCSGCDYIMDPEAFFGDANYLLHLLLHDSGSNRKWKMIVVEDAGEFLSADAKVATGQSLSRLLNATEGIIGQGLRVVFLFSTNERIGKLHPALKRAGRCKANIEFNKLPLQQARGWLVGRGVDAHPESAKALSDLYSLAGEEEVIKNEDNGRREGLGFDVSKLQGEGEEEEST
jgi:hypothetical protein